MTAVAASAMAVRRTVYMLDDNADFCSTARWWLEGAGGGYAVVDFQDARLALAALKALTPEEIAQSCLLLDIRMPEVSGLQVHDELLACGIVGVQARPALPVIYMTGHADVPLAVKAMEKGAVTFLEKPFKEGVLEDALVRAFTMAQATYAVQAARAAHATAAVMAAAAESGNNLHPACPEYARRRASLSTRELQVLDGVVERKTNKMIARDLGISFKTVELHRRHVMEKMQAISAADLTRMVVRRRV